MPIYRYRCEQCGHEFKIMAPFHQESDVQVCGQCGARAAHRQFGRVATVYKGSGFYSTNYRKNGSKEATSGSAERSKSATSESE